jgi:hypothetical protein
MQKILLIQGVYPNLRKLVTNDRKNAEMSGKYASMMYEVYVGWIARGVYAGQPVRGIYAQINKAITNKHPPVRPSKPHLQSYAPQSHPSP